MPKIRYASVFVILPSNPPRWYFALFQACNRVFILNTDGFGMCFRCCCTRLVIAGNVLAINLPVKPAVASPNPVYIIEVAITTITFRPNAHEMIFEKLCLVDSSSAKYKESSGLIQLGNYLCLRNVYLLICFGSCVWSGLPLLNFQHSAPGFLNIFRGKLYQVSFL